MGLLPSGSCNWQYSYRRPRFIVAIFLESVELRTTGIRGGRRNLVKRPHNQRFSFDDSQSRVSSEYPKMRDEWMWRSKS